MKLVLLSEFQTLLDHDHAWRIKELSEIKSMVATNRDMRQKMLIRAGIALAYAHWEGFIKNAAQWYLVHINSQRHTYSQLKPQFGVFGLKSHLHSIINSKKHKLNTESLEYILNNLDQRVYMSLSNAVDTESNLNSSVFDNIAFSINIDTARYSLRYNFIDERLLNMRNGIAHGENPGINVESFKETVDLVLELIRSFKTDVENGASGKSYLR